MPELDWDIRRHVRDHVTATGGTVDSYHDGGYYRVGVHYGRASHIFYGSLPRNVQEAWEMAWHFVRNLPVRP